MGVSWYVEYDAIEIVIEIDALWTVVLNCYLTVWTAWGWRVSEFEVVMDGSKGELGIRADTCKYYRVRVIVKILRCILGIAVDGWECAVE